MRHVLTVTIGLLVGLPGCGANDPPPLTKQTPPDPVPTVTPKAETARKPTETSPVEPAGVGRLPMELPPVGQLNARQLTDGWIQLFDGETLFGWTANSDANWHVANGRIRAEVGNPGLLLTTVPFADYELLVDFRLAEGGNSGVFLRTTPAPKDPSRDCYELNICDSHPSFPTASLVGRHKGPGGIDVEGEWHTFRVRLEGLRIEVELDGKSVVEFTDNSEHPRRTGRIGLQMNVGTIEFRNISLRPLGTTPLFNGKDLSGWRQVPGGKSRFSVVDGAIHVENGAGFLETESAWGDFVLQAEARTNGRELNSGIFFRAQPGTAEAPSNGYELQIHNGLRHDDPWQPSNAGTGAIFRRNNARFVAARDNHWCHLTLLAKGPRFAVWVNGLQVTDWLDERKPDVNPRRGLRLAAGQLSLQGHDPTTDLDFRNLRAVPLP